MLDTAAPFSTVDVPNIRIIDPPSKPIGCGLNLGLVFEVINIALNGGV